MITLLISIAAMVAVIALIAVPGLYLARGLGTLSDRFPALAWVLGIGFVINLVARIISGGMGTLFDAFIAIWVIGIVFFASRALQT